MPQQEQGHSLLGSCDIKDSDDSVLITGDYLCKGLSFFLKEASQGEKDLRLSSEAKARGRAVSSC